MSKERALAGKIAAPVRDTRNEAPPIQKTGRIRTTAKTVVSKPAEIPDESTPLPPPFTTIFGGVSTHAVTLNSLQPYMLNPFTWDVLTYPYVRMTQAPNGYVLPNPLLKIKDYFNNPDLEFDEVCLLNKLGPNLPNGGDWNTYAIRARVEIFPEDVQNGITNEQIVNFLSRPTNLGYALNVNLVGLGAFANNTIITESYGTIRRSVVVSDGQGGQEIVQVVEPFELSAIMNPALNAVGAIVDLTLYSINGSAWEAIGIRLT